MIGMETYAQLMTNAAHLEAEATVTVLENLVTAAVGFVVGRRWLRRHDETVHPERHVDRYSCPFKGRHGHEDCE